MEIKKADNERTRCQKNFSKKADHPIPLSQWPMEGVAVAQREDLVDMLSQLLDCNKQLLKEIKELKEEVAEIRDYFAEDIINEL